jgi:hypothetical protein
MNNKGYERKQSWHNLRYCPEIFLETLRKTAETSATTDPTSGRDLNSVSPKDEAYVPSTLPLCSANNNDFLGYTRAMASNGHASGILRRVVWYRLTNICYLHQIYRHDDGGSKHLRNVDHFL